MSSRHSSDVAMEYSLSFKQYCVVITLTANPPKSVLRSNETLPCAWKSTLVSSSRGLEFTDTQPPYSSLISVNAILSDDLHSLNLRNKGDDITGYYSLYRPTCNYALCIHIIPHNIQCLSALTGMLWAVMRVHSPFSQNRVYMLANY